MIDSPRAPSLSGMPSSGPWEPEIRISLADQAEIWERCNIDMACAVPMRPDAPGYVGDISSHALGSSRDRDNRLGRVSSRPASDSGHLAESLARERDAARAAFIATENARIAEANAEGAIAALRVELASARQLGEQQVSHVAAIAQG